MPRFLAIALLAVLWSWGACAGASAHETQPGSLELRQVTRDRYEVTWRAPIYYGQPHPARLVLPDHWQDVAAPSERMLPDSQVFQRVVTVGENGVEGSRIRFPWVVAFLFGLLHGFGFASGLSTTGMPRAEIPASLLFFNVGVELGQLVFVFIALVLVRPGPCTGHDRRGTMGGAARQSGHVAAAGDLSHGHAHGTELPPGQSGLLYSMGFVFATGILHTLGIALGLIHRWPAGRLALRGAGALIAVMGVTFFWRALA